MKVRVLRPALDDLASSREFYNQHDIAGYFERFSSRAELLESQKQSLDWQQNELAAYKKAKAQEKKRS